MTTLIANSTATVTLQAGYALYVIGNATATFGAGPDSARAAYSFTGQAIIGPYAAATQAVTITTGATAVNYQTMLNGEIEPSLRISRNTTTGNIQGVETDVGNIPDAAAATGAALGRKALFGQAATKCKVPHYIDTTNKQALGQRQHVAMAALPSGLWQIVVPNFYTLVGSTGEAGSGAVASVNAAIEYPKGTCTQVLFSGSATGSIADNSFLASDGIPVNIPRGARFWVRLFIQSAGGIVASIGVEGQLDTTATGDNTQKAVSGLTDTTMTPGAVTNTTGAQGIGCCAILAPTMSPAIFAWGDSIIAGVGDSGFAQASLQGEETLTTALGYTERSLARQVAYILSGTPGELAQNIAAGSASYYANRLALSQYCAIQMSNFGTNDLSTSGGRTAAQLIADVGTVSGITGLPVYWQTLPPFECTSTDGYTTYLAMTAGSHNVARNTFNTTLRAGQIPAVAGVIEIDRYLEAGKDSGIWRTWPTARVVADAVMTASSAVLTSATAAFTQDDIGAIAYVAGAKVAGGNLTQYIVSVQSATQVTLFGIAGTSVSGAALRIGYNGSTTDGTHPYAMGNRSLEDSLSVDIRRLAL